MELSLYTRPSDFSESDSKGKCVVVIDVLRASSTIVHACENGVERVIPVASVEDATKLVSTLDRKRTLLGGEREGIKIDGFDLGNSPLEYTSKVVKGKTLIFSTSNGTVAISRSAPAKEIVPRLLPEPHSRRVTRDIVPGQEGRVALRWESGAAVARGLRVRRTSRRPHRVGHAGQNHAQRWSRRGQGTGRRPGRRRRGRQELFPRPPSGRTRLRERP